MLVSAKIPAQTFKNTSQIVYSFLFRNDILFQTGKQLPITSVISSKVLAVTVGKEKLENLTLPVVLMFKKSKKILKDRQVRKVEHTCTFWDPPNKRKS